MPPSCCAVTGFPMRPSGSTTPRSTPCARCGRGSATPGRQVPRRLRPTCSTRCSPSARSILGSSPRTGPVSSSAGTGRGCVGATSCPGWRRTPCSRSSGATGRTGSASAWPVPAAVCTSTRRRTAPGATAARSAPTGPTRRAYRSPGPWRPGQSDQIEQLTRSCGHDLGALVAIGVHDQDHRATDRPGRGQGGRHRRGVGWVEVGREPTTRCQTELARPHQTRLHQVAVCHVGGRRGGRRRRRGDRRGHQQQVRLRRNLDSEVQPSRRQRLE